MKRFVAISLSVILVIFAGFAGAGCIAASQVPDESGNVSFVLLGDSIADGAGLTNVPAQQYGAVIADEMGYTLINDSVSGDKTGDMLDKISNVSTTKAHIKAADIIGISIGGNNVLQLSQSEMISLVSQGADGALATSLLDSIKSQYLEIIKQLRLLNPTCTIYLQSVYNPAHGTNNSLYMMAESFLNDFAPKARDVVAAACDTDDNMYMVDIYDTFEQHYISTKSTDYIQSDWVHPTIKGHAAIADEYVKLMSEHTKSGVLPTPKDNFTYNDIYNLSNGVPNDITTRYNSSSVILKDGSLFFDGKSGVNYDGLLMKVTVPENAVGLRVNIKASSAGDVGVICGTSDIAAANRVADTAAIFRVAPSVTNGTEAVVMFSDHMTAKGYEASQINNILLYAQNSDNALTLSGLQWIIAPTKTVKMYGNVNADSLVNTKDVLAMRKFLANIITVSDISFDNADINSDNVINTKDLLLLRKHLSGMHVSPWE